MQITTIATRWGTTGGGLNVFNMEFSLALAKFGYSVACVVLKASADEIEEAQRNGVELYSAGFPEMDYATQHFPTVLQILGVNGIGDRTDCWIGHDVKTGPLAAELRDSFGVGQLAIVHHMDYERYKGFEGLPGKRVLEQVNFQRKILNQADVVFGVGPKLTVSAKDKIGRTVYELIPGFPNVTPSGPTAGFRVITYGRMMKGSNRVKQLNLAVEGFGRAVSMLNHRFSELEPILTILGIDDNPKKSKVLEQLAHTYANRTVMVNAAPFLDKRSELLEELARHSAALMLSIHEGFGLVAWEAIAAEVPIILTRNCGVHELIRTRLGGMGMGCVKSINITGNSDETDRTAVAEALVEIANDPVRSKRDASALRLMLNHFCSWDQTAQTFAQATKLLLGEEPLSVGLAGGLPDVTLVGHLDPKIKGTSANQLKNREQWHLIAEKVAKLLIKYGLRVRYSGTNAGNLSALIVQKLIHFNPNAPVSTYFYGNIETDEAAREDLLMNFPHYYRNYNADPHLPYLQLMGQVQWAAERHQSRINLVDDSHLLFAAAGSHQVLEMLNRAMAQRLPIIALCAFGGATLAQRETICRHNDGLPIATDIKQALLSLAMAPLDQHLLGSALENTFLLLATDFSLSLQ